MEILLRELNLVFAEVVKAKEYLRIYRRDDYTKNITRFYMPNDTKLMDLLKNTQNIRYTRINELYGATGNTSVIIQQLYADMENSANSQQYEGAVKKRESIIQLQIKLSKDKLTENNLGATFIKKISDNEIGYHLSPCYFLNGYLQEIFFVPVQL
jgi:hypothetical protein